MAEQNDYGSDVLAEVTTLTDRLNLATLTGFPAIATAVKDMTDALDQLFNTVLKVYNAVSTLTALNLLESESETTNQEFSEAIQNLIYVTDLAYQFIDKINDLNYHFQTPEFKSEVEKMTSKEHIQQLLNTLSKTKKAMSDAGEIYTNLIDKCRKIATNCSKAEQFCHNKANTETQTLQELLEGQLQVQH